MALRKAEQEAPLQLCIRPALVYKELWDITKLPEWALDLNGHLSKKAYVVGGCLFVFWPPRLPK